MSYFFHHEKTNAFFDTVYEFFRLNITSASLAIKKHFFSILKTKDSVKKVQSIKKKWISIILNEKYFATFVLNLIYENHSSELIRDKIILWNGACFFFCWPASFALKEAKSNSLQFYRNLHLINYLLLLTLFWFHAKHCV